MTAGEREARWGHRGGVLELSGPAELIDAVERSLFAVGAVTVRMVTSCERTRLLAKVPSAGAGGLLALVMRPDESDELTARSEGRAISTRRRTNRVQAVAAVHQLLRDAGVFVAAERAGSVMSTVEIQAETNAKLDQVRTALEERRLPATAMFA